MWGLFLNAFDDNDDDDDDDDDDMYVIRYVIYCIYYYIESRPRPHPFGHTLPVWPDSKPERAYPVTPETPLV